MFWFVLDSVLSTLDAISTTPSSSRTRSSSSSRPSRTERETETRRAPRPVCFYDADREDENARRDRERSEPRPANAANIARRAARRLNPAYKAIAELDSDLRSFMVRSTEGEVCSVDTSDRGSIFYGPAWTRILGAYESGEFIRGAVKRRMFSRANGKLSGYIVDISGVDVFMPISKSAWFRTPEHDPVGKCVAVKVTAVYPNGEKTGTVTVDAWEPWKSVLKSRPSEGTVFRMAMDHDGRDLIFPLYGMETARAPLGSALEAARAAGLECGAGLLTGHIWQLRMHGRGEPCEVISCEKD